MGEVEEEKSMAREFRTGENLRKSPCDKLTLSETVSELTVFRYCVTILLTYVA